MLAFQTLLHDILLFEFIVQNSFFAQFAVFLSRFVISFTLLMWNVIFLLQRDRGTIRDLIRIFLPHIEKYEFCNVGIYLYFYLSKNPIFDLCSIIHDSESNLI